MNSVPLWRSLRLRLPLLISGLIVVVLVAFLWTVNRFLEQTLLRAGGVRAQAAADQVAAVMATATTRGVNEVRRMAATDEIRRYLLSPSAEEEIAVRRVLLPLAVANQPPVVLLNRSGEHVLEVAPRTGGPVTPSVTTAPRLAATGGLTEFRSADGFVFYDVVADVADRPSADGAQPAVIGSLVVRRMLTAAQTTENINRLVGGGAVVAVGNQRGDVWSTFSKPLPAPPIDAAHSGIGEYTRADGDARVGAASVMGGTPWTVWVEMSKPAILQPARTVLGRMLLVAIALVVLAAIVVAIVSARITRPLHELTVASSAIAAGEFSRRVPQATRSDEIGVLGTAFNTMTEYVDRDHQELERRVRERTQGLQEAMNELEAFSYSVSHDLRAPLRHIAGFATLLDQSASPLDADGKRYVATIVGAATRMGQLIDDLLAFSRVGRAAMSVRRVDVGELVREVQGEIAQSDPAVDWKVGELPVVTGDRALLRLVFVNLISNAVKYSSKRERPAIEIGVSAERDDQRPVIFVRDNGVGFDMNYVHKLFGVFSRLHSADDFEGTGIGLANVRRIVTRHGGRVWAQAEVDRGATFYVSLPGEKEAA